MLFSSTFNFKHAIQEEGSIFLSSPYYIQRWSANHLVLSFCPKNLYLARMVETQSISGWTQCRTQYFLEIPEYPNYPDVDSSLNPIGFLFSRSNPNWRRNNSLPPTVLVYVVLKKQVLHHLKQQICMGPGSLLLQVRYVYLWYAFLIFPPKWIFLLYFLVDFDFHISGYIMLDRFVFYLRYFVQIFSWSSVTKHFFCGASGSYTLNCGNFIKDWLEVVCHYYYLFIVLMFFFFF